jgi:glucose-1-phosphate cytidylyltransferase
MNQMERVVILAGGFGTRLTEETDVRPKPMVEIGGRPICWHIMKYFAHYGVSEFFLALGYKSEYIKRYFLDYARVSGSLSVDLASGMVDKRDTAAENWKVHLMETGLHSMTGGRVKRLEPVLKDGRFLLTYGDGVANVDLKQLIAFHEKHGKIATITAVRPPARFGGLVFDGDIVSEFTEKPQIGEGWINGGFMVLEPGIFKYLENDESILEAHALERLAKDKQLVAFRHEGFWQCMDTLRDMRVLEKLWGDGGPQCKAPWKVWT